MDKDEKNINDNEEDVKKRMKEQIKRNADKFLADLAEVEDDDNYDEIDDIRYKALKFCLKKGYASASLIQRRFPVGFLQSHKIFNWMISNNFVSREQNDGKYKVVIMQDELDTLIIDNNAENISSEKPENSEGNQFDNSAKLNQSISQKIVIFGVGAAGCNIVSMLRTTQNIPADFYLVNDDPNELAEFHNINTIWVGAEPHDNHNFEYGKKAGIEFKKDIEHAIYRADLVIVVAGIGGGIGSGTSTAITEIARENKIHTVVVVSTPFSFEGKLRLSNAKKSLKELKSNADITIVVPFDRIKEIVPSTTVMRNVMKLADNTVLEVLKTLLNPFISPAAVNLDFFEMLSVLRDSNDTYFGSGIAEGKERVVEAVRSALNYPLSNTRFENIKGVILYVEGGDDLTLDETMEVATYVRTAADSSCNIMFATNINSTLTGKIKVSILAAKTSMIEKEVNENEENQDIKFSYCDAIPESGNRSDELNKILKAAKDAADEYGSSYIGSEHLIYAMLDNECIAGKLLLSCNVNVIKYSEYFERTIDSRANIKGFTPRTKYMIEQAETFAKDIDGEDAIAGTEHLLLAVLSSSERLAMRILKAIDVNIENLASTLEKVLRTND